MVLRRVIKDVSCAVCPLPLGTARVARPCQVTETSVIEVSISKLHQLESAISGSDLFLVFIIKEPLVREQMRKIHVDCLRQGLPHGKRYTSSFTSSSPKEYTHSPFLLGSLHPLWLPLTLKVVFKIIKRRKEGVIRRFIPNSEN